MSSKAPKSSHKRQTPQKGQGTKRPMSVMALVLGLATLIGGIAAALALLPRITVSATDPVDPANPFSASFTVTNSGFIPVRSTNIGFGLGEIGSQGATPTPNFTPTYWPRMYRPEWEHISFGLDDRITISPGDIFGIHNTNLAFADIAVIVSYETPIIPWRREKVFAFIAHRQTNGQFYWYSKPIKSN